MTKFLNNLKHEADSLRMTKAEKSAMLARVLGTESPIVVQKSPYVFLSYFSYTTRMSLAGFLLFLVAGLSTVSAAQQSLPGDALYALKLSLNEKVELALAPDDAAKATLEAQLAERRVEEAQSLASQGKLDTQNAETLAASFTAHAENAEALADAVESAEPGTSVQVKTKLASSLAANGEILKKLGKNSTNKGTKDSSAQLSDQVIARADTSAAQNAAPAATMRTFAAMAPAPENAKMSVTALSATAPAQEAAASSSAVVDAKAQKRAAYLQKKAAEALEDARGRFDDTKSKLDATSSADVEASFAQADGEMSAGATALGVDDFAAAQQHFTAALALSSKLSALLKAEQKFDNGILKSLIRAETDGAAEATAPAPSVQPLPFNTGR